MRKIIRPEFSGIVELDKNFKMMNVDIPSKGRKQGHGNADQFGSGGSRLAKRDHPIVEFFSHAVESSGGKRWNQR
jgi:hypothetical protein